MKAAFESINAGNRSFIVRRFRERSFSAPYHYHPELELTLIVKGSGKRYVASNMSSFNSGDFVLLGSNLPHCWKTENNKTGNSISVVIHFTADFMGDDFFYKPELSQILQLLNKSQFGIHFEGNNETAKTLMLQAPAEKDDFKKLLLLMQILYELALSKSYVVLNKKNMYADLSVNDKERMNKVMAHIVSNFKNVITLNETAAQINMTPHAFCKYFKKHSRKTFIEAVNEYRVDFAARQLTDTTDSVADIGYDSGFNDISNFFRTFKRQTKFSPLNYRKTFAKKLMS